MDADAGFISNSQFADVIPVHETAYVYVYMYVNAVQENLEFKTFSFFKIFNWRSVASEGRQHGQTEYREVRQSAGYI